MSRLRLKEKPLTYERLIEALSYDPLTGVFLWRNLKHHSSVINGDCAGSIDNGYVRIKVDGVNYRGHHLAWLYMTGKWPTLEIDHRDLDRSNNRWLNLRECTQPQNTMNAPRYRNNTSGFKGVTYRKESGKWRARLGNGGCVQLGNFNTKEEAFEAYRVAALAAAGEFARFE